jgi:hypothetical protein
MAATLFNLWNPYRADDGTLTFEISQADTFRIHRGTQAFLDAALQALGVAVDGACTWEIVPGRALYYSSYPTDDGWRDRWARAWRVRVVPEAPLPPRANRLLTEPVELSESDTTWDVDDDDQDRYLHTAFVIADFAKPRDEVERLAAAGLAQAGPAAALLEPAIRALGKRVHQLQILVRGIDLPGDVATLDTLVAHLRAAGGVVNWNDHPAWPEEPEPTATDAKADAWMARLAAMRNDK